MKAFLKKANAWLGAPMSLKVFYVLVGTGLFLYLAQLLTTSVYDADMYFLIASGREILKNGIPHNNVWTIDSSSGIVIQQWLYAVLVSIAAKFDYWGFLALLSAQMTAFFVLLWKFFDVRKIHGGLRLFIISIIAVFGQIYLFTLRPELITIVLLLAECLVLEKYRLDGKCIRLLWLPVLMLMEINLHASMWPVHFLVMLAYAVPAFYLPWAVKDDLHKHWGALLISAILSGAVMFVNPYGLDGIMYTIRSFQARTFDYIKVREMMEPTFLSGPGCNIILAVALVGICLKFKKLTSVTTNFACGFGLLACYAIRNNMFMIIAFIFLFRDLCDVLVLLSDKIDWKKNVQNYCWFLFGGFAALMVYVFTAQMMAISGTTIDEMSPAWENIYDEIQKDYNPDMHVFTGFNCGAFFEYKGMKNLYMDARPELYTDTFTGDKHLLRNYATYCAYGFDNTGVGTLTRSAMDEWFNGYDFDYVIVSIKTEMALNVYMMSRDDYKLIEDVSEDGIYCLYKKVG